MTEINRLLKGLTGDQIRGIVVAIFDGIEKDHSIALSMPKFLGCRNAIRLALGGIHRDRTLRLIEEARKKASLG